MMERESFGRRRNRKLPEGEKNQLGGGDNTVVLTGQIGKLSSWGYFSPTSGSEGQKLIDRRLPTRFQTTVSKRRKIHSHQGEFATKLDWL